VREKIDEESDEGDENPTGEHMGRVDDDYKHLVSIFHVKVQKETYDIRVNFPFCISIFFLYATF
jgi:hypothetical protein